MTIDTVDHLHAAEDEVGRLHDALARVAAVIADADPCEGNARVIGDIDAILSSTPLYDYCRGCEQDEDGEWDCDDDCGCPCGHAGRDE